MNTKIKILLALEATGGGALKHVAYLVSNLNRNIFDITLIYSSRTVEEQPELERLKSLDIRVIQMQMPKKLSLLGDLHCLIQVTRFLRKNRFDVVHAHSSKAGFYFRIASWLNHVPVVAYTPHCFYFQAKTGIKRLFFECIERVLARATDAIITSKNEREQGIKSRITSEDKLININNAIDFKDYTIYERETALRDLGLCEKSTIIGTVGRFEEQKDLLTLIRAAKKLVHNVPGLYFIIAGNGDQNALLKNEIVKLELSNNVILIDHEINIDRIFSAIDIFVSTSLWEGLPYVILEAMFYKKPIVATDIGYRDILVDNENGFLIPPKDITSLCERLKLLIKDKAFCETIGRKNRQNLDLNFSFKRFISSHEELYLNLFNASNIENCTTKY